ncbi:MAG: nitrilase-related carbon-nitrogen hydrolase [Desulfobulbales bacterium]|nr:nitrilase-related carbon-nitrogen hydrolase [Desulfobulbales bacterium]
MSETVLNIPAFFAGFLQFDVQSGALDVNLSRVREGLAEIAASHKAVSPGIIVLPELWATGFAYEHLPTLAGAIPGLLETLRETAAQYQVILAGSLPEYSGSSFYNTLYITDPAGQTFSYRKQRLFAPMGEDGFFSPGANPEPMQTSLGPIAGLVCYDLRFPELLRKQTALGADLLVVSAQWPAARVNHWRILLQARAIENQMYVVAANRCGTTGDTTFAGHSMIIGPDGSILLEAAESREYRGTMLDPGEVSAARTLFNSVPER